MLYVTTREKYDAFTAPRTLTADCGTDGGPYVPYQLPRFSQEELREFEDLRFGQTAARILNLFFSSRLSAWDIETAVGRHPMQMVPLGNEIRFFQLWKNLEGSYEKLELSLMRKVGEGAKLTSWLRIAIRISVLFAAFGEYRRSGALEAGKTVNIAVPADDFLMPMAAWYARGMGLPIQNIICACQKSSLPWELLHLGEARLDADEALLRELERLFFGALGIEEAKRFAEIAQRRGNYKLLPVEAEKLRSGMFCAIVSRERLNVVIPSVYRTNQCSLSPDSALSYAALMDYRAKTGSKRAVLLLEDNPPSVSFPE